MRPVLLNITTSLDGFIADRDGGIGWLIPPPSRLPDEYVRTMRAVDTLIMGRLTYETSLSVEGGTEVFEGKDVYVFTSRDDLPTRRGVSFVHEDPEPFVRRLKELEGGTIWLFGGGRLATALAAAGLIDDYLIVLQPIVLGDGIPLWRGSDAPVMLEAVGAEVWPDGLIAVRYRGTPGGTL